jgi:tetratricopeptide (TPR) repeat protein
MRITLFSLVLILAWICVPPSSAQDTDLKTLIETGKYTEAETTARKLLTKTPADGRARHQLAETLAITGRYADAITEFERAATDLEKANNIPGARLESDLRRAELLDLIGQDAAAKTIYEAFVTYYTSKDPETAFELTMIARALVHLERYQDANDLYRAALEADSDYLDAHLSAAELFTQKYNYADAAQFLSDALKLQPNSARAFLDVARNKRLEGGDEVNAAIERALKINPNYVEALSLKAALALEAGQYPEASVEIEKALKVNAHSVEAHALRAAMYYLQDREYEPEITATLAIGPRYGEVYNTLAHYATITRRTEQAVQFARRRRVLRDDWSKTNTERAQAGHAERADRKVFVVLKDFDKNRTLRRELVLRR